MRQIKFRAWHIKDKCYCESVSCGAMSIVGYDIHEIFNNDIILEQFTGLLDKDKKDSYDGDKIRTSNWGDVVVEWNGHAACFGFYYKSKFGKSWVPLYKVVEFEIIGNIHEDKP